MGVSDRTESVTILLVYKLLVEEEAYDNLLDGKHIFHGCRLRYINNLSIKIAAEIFREVLISLV